jgi:hypothetical protein
MKVNFKSAKEIVCELNWAIPKSRELKVYASVNGGYHPLTKTFTFPIMAPAPAIKSCKFSNNGKLLSFFIAWIFAEIQCY